jgi:hypothetical protein
MAFVRSAIPRVDRDVGRHARCEPWLIQFRQMADTGRPDQVRGDKLADTYGM